MMHKNIIFIFLCLFIISCSKENSKQSVSKGYVLTIDFNETVNTSVFLSEFTKNGVVIIDSANIENNKAVFKGKVDYPSRYTVGLNTTPGRKLLIIANDSIQLKINNNEIAAGIISGSAINDTLIAHQRYIRKTFKKVDALFPEIQRARMANDASTLQNISNKIKSVEQEVLEINYTFANTHPNSFISAMILNDLSKRDSIDGDRLNKLYQNLSPRVKKGKDAVQLKLFLDTTLDH